MNRRGRSMTCQVICTPLARGDEIHGAIVLMEQVENPKTSDSS
jgi:hypothetical protein